MWIEKVTLDHDDCHGGLAGNEKLFTFGAPAKQICPGGEIGRHVRLRGVCRKVCWFESSPGHTSPLAPLLEERGRGNAEVVKLVDTHVSGACAVRYAGSSPAFGTLKTQLIASWVFLISGSNGTPQSLAGSPAFGTKGPISNLRVFFFGELEPVFYPTMRYESLIAF